MPMFIFAMLFRIALETARVVRRKSRETKPQPLCARCIHAHVQYGANARRTISCTYGGGLRPMKLDVLYCTDHQTRNSPARARVIGFVHEIVVTE